MASGIPNIIRPTQGELQNLLDLLRKKCENIESSPDWRSRDWDVLRQVRNNLGPMAAADRVDFPEDTFRWYQDFLRLEPPMPPLVRIA